MDSEWKELDHDPVSGRKIFAADDRSDPNSPTNDFDVTVMEKFEVRNAKGEILLKAFCSANLEDGGHWAGVFLFFVKRSDGKRVRLDQLDNEDIFCDVPDEPSDPPKVLPHRA